MDTVRSPAFPRMTSSARAARATVVHATERGLPELLIEVRQDLLDTDGQVAQWARILAPALHDVLARDDVYRVEHFA